MLAERSPWEERDGGPRPAGSRPPGCHAARAVHAGLPGSRARGALGVVVRVLRPAWGAPGALAAGTSASCAEPRPSSLVLWTCRLGLPAVVLGSSGPNGGTSRPSSRVPGACRLGPPAFLSRPRGLPARTPGPAAWERPAVVSSPAAAPQRCAASGRPPEAPALPSPRLTRRSLRKQPGGTAESSSRCSRARARARRLHPASDVAWKRRLLSLEKLPRPCRRGMPRFKAVA